MTLSYSPLAPMNEYADVPVRCLLSLKAGTTFKFVSTSLTKSKSSTVGHPVATESDKISQITLHGNKTEIT